MIWKSSTVRGTFFDKGGGGEGSPLHIQPVPGWLFVPTKTMTMPVSYLEETGIGQPFYKGTYQ